MLAAVGFVSGIFGLHRFYSGHILIGILQLLTGGGFLVWAVIDVVRLAQGTFRDAEELPLRRPAAA